VEVRKEQLLDDLEFFYFNLYLQSCQFDSYKESIDVLVKSYSGRSLIEDTLTHEFKTSLEESGKLKHPDYYEKKRSDDYEQQRNG